MKAISGDRRMLKVAKNRKGSRQPRRGQPPVTTVAQKASQRRSGIVRKMASPDSALSLASAEGKRTLREAPGLTCRGGAKLPRRAPTGPAMSGQFRSAHRAIPNERSRKTTLKRNATCDGRRWQGPCRGGQGKVLSGRCERKAPVARAAQANRAATIRRSCPSQ